MSQSIMEIYVEHCLSARPCARGCGHPAPEVKELGTGPEE